MDYLMAGGTDYAITHFKKRGSVRNHQIGQFNSVSSRER